MIIIKFIYFYSHNIPNVLRSYHLFPSPLSSSKVVDQLLRFQSSFDFGERASWPEGPAT